MVNYGKDLVAAKEVRLTAKIAYHGFGPSGENLRELFNELGFSLWFLLKRLGVDDMAIVLGEALHDEGQVFLLKPPAPFFHELDVWGNGAGHCGGATRGCPPEDPKAGPGLYILHPPGHPEPLVCVGLVNHSQLVHASLDN